MDDETILSFLKSRGPSLPSDISKQIKTNTVFIGAHLSTMIEKKLISISNIKIGSSPLYYLVEHKARLEQFIKYLDEKDRRAFELLKQKKILRDNEQNPLVRVSLRSIKDFAVQLNVRTSISQEIFWKIYSISDEEASSMIRGILEPPSIKKQVEPQKEEMQKLKPEIKDKLPELKKEEPKEQKTELKKSEQVKEKPRQKRQTQEKLMPQEEQKTCQQPGEKELIKGDFYDTIIDSFAKKSINLVSIGSAKGEKEYDLIIRLPSAAGELTYYCRAKSKKKINEGDLSSAVLKSQSKRLPALFLTDGELTKQAEKSLNEELKDQIKVMKI
jgi:hypothetical protein